MESFSSKQPAHKDRDTVASAEVKKISGNRERIKNVTSDIVDKKELIDNFNALDDLSVAHSVITGKLFDADGEDETILAQMVVKRIEEIKILGIKDNTFFRIAKLYYENKNNLEEALEMVNKISSTDEQTRCLVHLACAILFKEGNLEKADSIIQKAIQDKHGYIKYYMKERSKIENSIN